MKTKRLGIIFCTYVLFMVLLAGACGFICFVKGDSYTREAVSQRSDSIVFKRYRGKIYDRNGVPLVDDSAVTLHLDENGKINTLGGSVVASVPVRYSGDSIARHVVGYVDSEGEGVSGIEMVYDNILKSPACDSVNVIKSADGRIIEKTSLNKWENTAAAGSVTLTIDSHIQKTAENAMKNHAITGAVVILDVESFDILAMASSPDYDQNNISEYISSDRGEFINRCVMPYNAGSIFKIITMCSATEKALLRKEYSCEGFVETQGHTFGCNTAQGHGIIGYEDAFSLSCNCAFYTMGLDVGSSAILSTAKKFGMGKTLISDNGIPDESSGNIPQGETATDTVNYSIGQGEILVTPLQAANMVCIIANGGIKRSINMILEVKDAYGNTETPPPDTQARVASAKSCEYIKRCMISAVQKGTAKALCASKARIAGKTGTAETGWEVDGRTLVHGWFCGFFPCDNPRYAMAVLAEDGGSGAASAAPVFGDIAEEIMDFYPYDEPSDIHCK